MSSISQWLRMEEIDRAEPVSFYIAGLVEWGRGRHQTRPPPPLQDYEPWEVADLLDRIDDE